MYKLGFVGETRLQTAKNLLPRVVSEWRSQWCFASEKDDVQVEVLSDIEPTQTASLGWVQGSVGFEQIGLAGNWQKILFGVQRSNVPDDLTAKHLIEKAQLALTNALLESLGRKHITELSALDEQPDAGPMSAKVHLRMTAANTRLYVAIDAGLLDACLPAVKTKALVSRNAAIGGAKIRLHIEIPLSSTSLENVQGIKPGDLLSGTAELIEPAKLKVESNRLAQGYLARQGQNIAIQLIP